MSIIPGLIESIEARLAAIPFEQERLVATLAVLKEEEESSLPRPRRPKAKSLSEREAIRVAAELGRFTVKDFRQRTGQKVQAARRSLERLLNRRRDCRPLPVIRVVGIKDSVTIYEYIDPRELPGPKARPTNRDETIKVAPQGTSPVAYTGKARGPSGKPGQNRKAAKRGHRIRSARNGT